MVQANPSPRRGSCQGRVRPGSKPCFARRLTGFRPLCYFDFTPAGEAAAPVKTASPFRLRPEPVITGFNTDVQHQGVTYHVQTEDKGLDSPLILSLVYVGGAIIASKRTPYEDLVGQGFDEKALTERLQRQHKLICAAIKAGRVEDLKRMGAPNGGASQPEPLGDTAPPAGARTAGPRRKKAAPAPTVETPVTVTDEASTPALPDAAVLQAEAAGVVEGELAAPPTEPLPVDSAASHAAAHASPKAEPEIVILTTLAEEVSALGDFVVRPEPKAEVEPPAQVPATPADAAPPTAAANNVPLPPETTPATASHEHTGEIYLSLLDDEGEFRAGQLVTIKVYVGRGAYGQRAQPDASVTVKVLGTSFRPIIMTATTDAHGVGVVRALLPRFTSGRAAIIIRAVAGEESAEMRRIIHQ